MFRPMRRAERALSDAQIAMVLSEGTWGTLSLAEDEGYPYAVPLNYVLDGDTLLFHCAIEGKKLDVLKRNPKVCFTVVTRSTVLPAEFTTDFVSVLLLGEIRILPPDEAMPAIRHFGKQFAPNHPKEMEKTMTAFPRIHVLQLVVAHATGKALKPHSL